LEDKVVVYKEGRIMSLVAAVLFLTVSLVVIYSYNWQG
jgi:hypothetical protein